MEITSATILKGSVPADLKHYGDGDGYGDGYGSGSGDGYGDGYGYGYGDGYGYGSGDGSGDGSEEYWAAAIAGFAAKWPVAQLNHLHALQREGAQIAYWRSDKQGRACNGGTNKPVTAGTIETATGPLRCCGAGTLHATLLPPKWEGERWWIVAMHGEVVRDGDKLGALKREIIGECL
jgi:hypothetical protein